MFIHRVASHLFAAPQLQDLWAQYQQNNDVQLSVVQTARPLVIASLWAKRPRPCLVVVSGNEAAERMQRALASWLGADSVLLYPERQDKPWQSTPRDQICIAQRMKALDCLHRGEQVIVVASARALLRKVPPREVAYYTSHTFALHEEYEFSQIPAELVASGYTQQDTIDTPGSFRVQGDTIEVYPAQEHVAYRMEFFDNELDRIRQMLSATGQTVADCISCVLAPCKEYALTEKTIAHAQKALYLQAQEDNAVALDLELLQQAADAPELEKYLPELYGKTALMLEHLHESSLVVLAEPRSLFDDCTRAYDEIAALADAAGERLEGLYAHPRELDFGTCQRLTLASLLKTGVQGDTFELNVKQPQIVGAGDKMLGRIRQLLADKSSVLFAVPDRSARQELMNTCIDEHISVSESLCSARENTCEPYPALEEGCVTFFDAPVPAGIVIPEAKLAVFSVSDLSARMTTRSKKRRIDTTQITFPFKPGDYVVHATHGIAYFADIVCQDVAGKKRDYFLLTYAHDDKLFVPFEQVDRITRYVGPDGDEPRLTRLNTADWTRATTKARKSAQKLAFDLVDLYTRRSSVVGHSFAGDSDLQHEMEAAFPYDLTPDQLSAVLDIKADMESTRPMDRLLCGDVGFGKTEVALRAACKCCADSRQVMVLCPTTILAQQHFETFMKRLSPVGIRVGVLSRFITAGQQKKTLERFAQGELDVLIGTHRLLSSDVNPLSLGLVIIDEEQRFGVQHKEQLKNMREQVDVLTLSATPIPRTMQMAMSGVRDMSLIMTPPPGRLPVKVTVGEYDPDVVSAAIREELARNGQVYYVSNRVTTIDEAVARVLEAAPEARIGIAHGKMSAREVEQVMLEFSEHEIDVLVATTIIESGIDNPHTNTLIIEDAQRLGLAQLYQLKGRVGRGRTQAYAYFMFPGDIPLTPEATDRLLALHEHQELGSGMKIAMRDLEIRGAGALMGAEQHGNLSGVGFDLFTQMLAEAVSEARGEVQTQETSEVVINLSADFYLSDDYLPDIDRRVLCYRQLAMADDLKSVDAIQADVESRYGELPEAGRNLFDRARIRIRAERLGLQTVMCAQQRLSILGIEVNRQTAERLKKRGALVYPTSKKLTYPYYKNEEDMVSAALGLIEELGGDDEIAE